MLLVWNINSFYPWMIPDCYCQITMATVDNPDEEADRQTAGFWNLVICNNFSWWFAIEYFNPLTEFRTSNKWGHSSLSSNDRMQPSSAPFFPRGWYSVLAVYYAMPVCFSQIHFEMQIFICPLYMTARLCGYPSLYSVFHGCRCLFTLSNRCRCLCTSMETVENITLCW